MGSQEKLQTGTVVSTKMDKTVVVRIDRSKRHRLYGKTLHTTRRYKAHDEKNECNLGDVVKISETRPLSREKRWRVVEIVTRGDVAELAPTDVGSTLITEISTAQAAAAADTAARERAESTARAADTAARAEAAAATAASGAADDEAAAAAGEQPDAAEMAVDEAAPEAAVMSTEADAAPAETATDDAATPPDEETTS